MWHTPRRREFAFDFRQMSVLRMLKPAFHVTKAVLVWYEIDVPLSAICIKREYLFCRHGRRMLPYAPMLLICKCVLHV